MIHKIGGRRALLGSEKSNFAVGGSQTNQIAWLFLCHLSLGLGIVVRFAQDELPMTPGKGQRTNDKGQMTKDK
jgi:hypothetical protein